MSLVSKNHCLSFLQYSTLQLSAIIDAMVQVMRDAQYLNEFYFALWVLIWTRHAQSVSGSCDRIYRALSVWHIRWWEQLASLKTMESGALGKVPWDLYLKWNECKGHHNTLYFKACNQFRIPRPTFPMVQWTEGQLTKFSHPKFLEWFAEEEEIQEVKKEEARGTSWTPSFPPLQFFIFGVRSINK